VKNGGHIVRHDAAPSKVAFGREKGCYKKGKPGRIERHSLYEKRTWAVARRRGKVRAGRGSLGGGKNWGKGRNPMYKLRSKGTESVGKTLMQAGYGKKKNAKAPGPVTANRGAIAKSNLGGGGGKERLDGVRGSDRPFLKRPGDRGKQKQNGGEREQQHTAAERKKNNLGDGGGRQN